MRIPQTFQLRSGREGMLRMVREEDAAELIGFLPRTHSESDFLHYLPGEFRLTADEEAKWIRDRLANQPAISLVAEVDGQIVGAAGAEPLPFRRFQHHANCGIVVARDFWGQGIGRTMMECLLEWARERGLRKLTLRVYARNERAIRLYESLGFVIEGRLVDDVRRADGTFDDTLLMAKFLAPS